MAHLDSNTLRLRPRLMIAVTLLLAGILVAAATQVIGNARQAVADEMASSVTLAGDIVEASLAAGGDHESAARRLRGIGHLRHLCIALVEHAGRGPACAAQPPPDAPGWFAALTRPDARPQRVIPIAADESLRILADPNDEIDEAWQDARGLLALLLIFYAVVLLLVYLLLGRAVVPLRRIDAALSRIEHGDYQTRLPSFALPEFDGIAGQFNHMAATLAATRDENHRLRDHSLRIQEDERRNLARELHDELGQSLTAIRADTAGILARRDQLPAGVADSAEAIADVAARIYDQMRLMMRRLRPPGLDEFGLDAALEEHIAGRQRSHAEVVVVYHGDKTRADVPAPIAIHVFRLVQEALTNALRHGKPERIDIALSTGAGRLRISIDDDGHGFDPAARRPGLGLSGMTERIDLLAGLFHLDSRPGRGTRIRVDIPLDASAAGGKNREDYP